MKFEQLQHATPSQLIEAFKLYAGNQKKNDRYGLAYLIGMIDHYAGLQAQYGNYKRAELLAMLFERINEKTIFRLIQSEHTANELAKLIPSTPPAPAVEFYENEGQHFEYTHTNGTTYTGQINEEKTNPHRFNISWDTFGPFEPFREWEEAEEFILSQFAQ